MEKTGKKRSIIHDSQTGSKRSKGKQQSSTSTSTTGRRPPHWSSSPSSSSEEEASWNWNEAVRTIQELGTTRNVPLPDNEPWTVYAIALLNTMIVHHTPRSRRTLGKHAQFYCRVLHRISDALENMIDENQKEKRKNITTLLLDCIHLKQYTALLILNDVPCLKSLGRLVAKTGDANQAVSFYTHLLNGIKKTSSIFLFLTYQRAKWAIHSEVTLCIQDCTLIQQQISNEKEKEEREDHEEVTMTSLFYAKTQLLLARAHERKGPLSWSRTLFRNVISDTTQFPQLHRKAKVGLMHHLARINPNRHAHEIVPTLTNILECAVNDKDNGIKPALACLAYVLGETGIEEKDWKQAGEMRTRYVNVVNDTETRSIDASSCAICLEEMEIIDPSSHMLLCGHTFHRKCWSKWNTVQRNAKKAACCAICRSLVGLQEPN